MTRTLPRFRVLGILASILLGSFLYACGTAATSAPAMTQASTAAAVATSAPLATHAPAKTQLPPTQLLTTSSVSIPTVTMGNPTQIHQSMLEAEWPTEIRLGDSDVVRLTVFPTTQGYSISTEFPDHQTQNEAVTIARKTGYRLSGVAQLYAPGFALSPSSEQVLDIPVDSKVTWRWVLTPAAAGRKRISLQLALRWTPLPPADSMPTQESQVFSKSYTIQVADWLGLSTQQAAAVSAMSLLLGGVFCFPVAWAVWRPRRWIPRSPLPNTDLVIEHSTQASFAPGDVLILQTLFRNYQRISLEEQFHSGYSGAKTYLILPVRKDGHIDAHTIAKIGSSVSIQREYQNFETFVKDTLPPVTARIQDVPVRTSDRQHAMQLAGLRYTFIGEPGQSPISLRKALLEKSDPQLLENLWNLFGPGWWMQRRPMSFRLSQEYDRLLPAHYTVVPDSGQPKGILDGSRNPTDQHWPVGTILQLRNFPNREPHPDGKYYSLGGIPQAGDPVLRVRWASGVTPRETTVRVLTTRELRLWESVNGLTLDELPDPVSRLQEILDERIPGTQSIIHGDLNLENVLIGPSGTMWLIDFSETREGHTLLDFAHLGAEIITQCVAAQNVSPHDYLAYWQTGKATHPSLQVLNKLREIASRCLFNPAQDREFRLAWFTACLGALKFPNLSQPQRQLLYLTASLLSRDL
jgi:hypothetical protein